MQNSKATHAILELDSTLDITRQPRHRNSTALDSPRQQLDAPPHVVSLDGARQELDRLDRQGLDNGLDGASTARQLDSQGSTAELVA